MAHCFPALKEMGLNRYAEVFAATGFGVLAYANRNLGSSDGEPRDEIDPAAQMRDYRHAVTYAQSRTDVDNERIGIWGTSYTGGLVIFAAATDRRVKCVVSQVPEIHAGENIQRSNTAESMHARLQLIDEERASLYARHLPRTVSVCSYDPNQPATSPGNRTYEFFHTFDHEGDFLWPNRITVRSLELRIEYDALAYVEPVIPTPLLIIVAGDDEITPTYLAMTAYDRTLETKNLHIVSGDHYRPYIEAFGESSSVSRDWFIANLHTQK